MTDTASIGDKTKEAKYYPNEARPSELNRTLLGIAGLNGFFGQIAGSRAQMFTSHLGQRPVTKGATENFLTTGMDYRIVDYNFNVRMPADGRILRVFDRYHFNDIAHGGIQSRGEGETLNPEKLAFYQNSDSGVVDIISLPNYMSFHPYFGFNLQENKRGMDQFSAGQEISKGTVFKDSPSANADGGNNYGTTLNMCAVNHPSVAEDGFMICEDVLDRFTYKVYERREIEWGKGSFPVAIYPADPSNPYKIFPEIGESIGPDGLLMVLRQFNDQDKTSGVLQRSMYDSRAVDYVFDTRVHAPAGGRIVDIKVITNSGRSRAVSDFDRQIDKYVAETKRYYDEIVSYYNELVRTNSAIEISPALHTLLINAYTYLYNDRKELKRPAKGISAGKDPSLNLILRETPLDNVRIEFVIEYDKKPGMGAKFTDMTGCKGVIVYIAKSEEMPMDADGRRADIVMDPKARVNRMNIGGSTEHYVNSATAKVCLNMTNALLAAIPDGTTKYVQYADLQIKQKNFRELSWQQLAKPNRYLKADLLNLLQTQPVLFDQQWEYLRDYYRMLSPKFFEWTRVDSGITDDDRIGIIEGVIRLGMTYLYIPPEASVEYEDVIMSEVEPKIKPTYGPVSFVDPLGRHITTERPARVAPMYFLFLEKTGEDNSAVASAKIQNMGVPARINKANKYAEPIRMQPVKFIGETENRLFQNNAGEYAAAEMMDRNANVSTHEDNVRSVITSKNPTQIDLLVNRENVPFDKNRPLQLFKHMAMCRGIELVYVNRAAITDLEPIPMPVKMAPLVVDRT